MTKHNKVLICTMIIGSALFVFWPTVSAQSPKGTELTSHPLVLQENGGERRIRRPGGPMASPEFLIKVDGENGNAQDFFVVTEFLAPGGTIPWHKHHNAEEILLLEEAGASVIVGDQSATAGPRSITFIPRDTWVTVTNTTNVSIHLTAVFSRQGFDKSLRGRSVRPGEPLTPITAEEIRRANEMGHAMFWDTTKGPYPPGVAHHDRR